MTNLKGGPVEFGSPAMTINPPPAKPEEPTKQQDKKESGDAETTKEERQDGTDTSR